MGTSEGRPTELADEHIDRQPPSAAARRLFREYPRQTVAVVALTLVSGLAEVFGITALLPLLTTTTDVRGDAGGSGDGLTDTFATALNTVGLQLTVPVLLLIIVVGIGLKVVLKILAMRQAGYAAAQVAQDLRLGLIEGLMEARWRYFTEQPVGRLANAVSMEAHRASTVFTKATDLISRIIQVSLYLGVAFLVSWQIALITLVTGTLMVVSLRSLVAIARRAGQQQTHVMKSLITRLSDGLYAIKPLKAMGRENSLRPLLEKETRDLTYSQERLVISSAAMNNAHELFIAVFAAIIVFVLLEVFAFPFSQILFVTFLFHRTSTYLGKLQVKYQAMMEAESAYWSIQNGIDEAQDEREVMGSGRAPALREAISFEDVSFHYDNRKPVLDAVSLRIPAGQFTAIIGPSGVGKTTIVDMVVGLYRPISGQVLLDGVPLDEIDLHAWRERIGYVPQELVLFHDTVLSNVAMTPGDADRDAAEQALRDAGAWDFVSALPDGLDSIVGEHGMRLSGGQRQRLAIARALVRQPDLLVLDEATTALDPETERGILRTLEQLEGRVTILAISHQPTLVEAAQHVIRLDDGIHGARVRVGEGHPTGAH